MLTNIVEKYYRFRGYPWPSTVQALLFLISEIGELAEALIACNPDKIDSEDDRGFLQRVVKMGQVADERVSGQGNWVRNNDRVKEPNVSDEIGDVIMMTVVFAFSLGLDAVQALYHKMAKKGFSAGKAIEETMRERGGL